MFKSTPCVKWVACAGYKVLLTCYFVMSECLLFVFEIYVCNGRFGAIDGSSAHNRFLSHIKKKKKKTEENERALFGVGLCFV